jgi:hypothetical protein
VVSTEMMSPSPNFMQGVSLVKLQASTNIFRLST